MPKHHEPTDRHHGGPGSSHQNADRSGDRPAESDRHPLPGEPTNGRNSRTSGGGGERDIHHTHDPRTKR